MKELFHDASLNIQVSANMRQKWSGHIGSEANAFAEGISPALPLAFFAIAYPLYIGISRNLRERLLTHRKQLEIYKVEPAVENATRGEDDDAESRYFGQRLGAVFNRAKFFETSRLYVKCVPWPQRLTGDPRGEASLDKVMNELRAAEWTCNTLFHPVFGRQ